MPSSLALLFAFVLAAPGARSPAAQARTAPPAKAAAPLAGLDPLVARAMATFRVPGVALAVVERGRVLVAKGYGVRKLGEPAPVGADTLFGIASNTKAFTCAALALLVEEGRLSWDDPVTKHLPEFQMYDPWVTREITVRDLVSHRAGLGLGEGDLMWWPATNFSRREIVRGIRWLKPATSLRSRYAYNNVLYVAAGEVVAAVSGRPWEDFVKERLVKPLGMTHTTIGVPTGPADAAAPHLLLKGALVPVAAASFDNAAAAAGVQSSAADMARWLRMLLECGASKEAPPGESCPLKPESIRSLWSAQTVLGTPDPAPGLESLKAQFAAYGLGFGLRDYRGRKLVSHSGGLPGYVSRVVLLPAERLGIVVLTNQEETGAFDAIVYGLLDGFLGAPVPPVDWVAAFHERSEDERRKAERAVAQAAAQRAANLPPLPLGRYAGRYRDPWYGEATLSEQDGRLVLAMTRTPGFVADLEPWQRDTFLARWRQAFMSDSAPADAYLSFALRADGSVERFTLEPVSPAIDFSFDYQDLLFTPVP